MIVHISIFACSKPLHLLSPQNIINCYFVAIRTGLQWLTIFFSQKKKKYKHADEKMYSYISEIPRKTV